MIILSFQGGNITAEAINDMVMKSNQLLDQIKDKYMVKFEKDLKNVRELFVYIFQL